MEQNKSKFGAYVHTRPDLSIFYVGKGTKTRARYMKRNAYHDRIVAKYGAEEIGVGFIECSSETISFELEIGLIKCLRRNGVRLTNMTDGGEGTSGMAQESRDKIAAAARLRTVPLEQRKRQAETMTGRKASEETKAKMREAVKHKKMPPFTEEHKKNLSLSHIGVSNGPRTEEQREYMASKMKGVKRKKPFSAESRARMSEAQRIRRENEKLTRQLGD